MAKLIHPVAGTVALLTIAAFWLSTLLSELIGSEAGRDRDQDGHTLGLPLADTRPGGDGRLRARGG